MATTAGLDRLKQAMRNAADQDEQKQPGSTSSGLARLDQAMQNAKIQDTRQQPKPLQNVRAAVEQLKTPVVTSTTGQLGSQERAQMLAQKNSQSRAAAKNSGYSQMLKTPFQTMQQQIAQSKAALAEVPDLTLVQQATRNFDDYNSRYDRDMDAFVQANARVTTLREAGVNDPEAEAALVGARNTLTDTQKQWNQVMQQTLDDLGVGTTAKIRQLIAEDEYRSRSGDKKDYEALHRELEGQLGKALLRDLTEYVRQQENAVTMDEKKQAAEDFANEHGGKASLVSIPKKIAGGVLGTADSLVQGGKRLISGSNAPMDWNAPAQTWGREAGTIRGTVSQNLNENTGNGVASFLYNTVMSMADSLAVMPLGGWGSVLLGTAAANDTMQEAVANGATDDQAMALGMIAGAAEVLTEKVSIDSLFQLEDATTVRQTLKNIVKQAIPEASEEATSSIINLLAEGVILGEQSQYEQLVQQGMERGLNRDQAAAQAFIQLAGDVGLDALGGAISGAAFATGRAGLDTALRGAGKISSRISDRAGNEPQAQNIPQVQQQETRQETQTEVPGLQEEIQRTQSLPTEELPGVEAEESQRDVGQQHDDGEPNGAAISDRARGLAQRLAALGEDGETAVELAQDIENYFWGSEDSETVVQRLLSHPAAVSVMEQLMEQGIRPEMETQNPEPQQRQQEQRRENSPLDEPILNTMQELDRQQRAAGARNETERTGILAGATTEQIEQAERIGKLVGREVMYFAEGRDSAGGIQNGYYNREDGRIYVNVNSKNTDAQIIAHELTHSLEQSGDYAGLRQLILQKIQSDGGDLAALRAEKQALYERHGITDVDVDAELVAEYVEQNLLTDEDSIREMVQQNRTLGQRIMEWIDHLLAKLGNKNAREREFLSRAKQYYQQALQQSQEAESNAQQQARSMEQLREQMASGALTEEEAWQVFNEIYDAEADLQNGLRGNRYSISEIEGEKQDYGLGVVLDTKVFNGVRPRDWGKVLGEYVYQNMAGTELTMYDEYGNPETVYLARENDRVKKDGAGNSHKVIDKLARYKGDNLRALATVQLSEALATSRSKSFSEEHSHQWMDENGWIYRTAYLQDKGGDIYEATLNIAAGRDRMILYDINNIRKIDKVKATRGVVPSTDNGRGSHTKGSFGDKIQENRKSVKKNFSISEEENLSDLDRMQLAALESMKEGTRQAETEQLRMGMPVKARQYLERTERGLLKKVQNALGVDKFSDKAALQNTIREISNEYLRNGTLTKERADALFEQAYQQGIVIEKEFYEQYRDIKNRLRTTAVTLDPGYESSIPDFRDFQKAAFGRLRLVKSGGLSVDTLYQELQQEAPNLFPAEIVNPADQLLRMFDVAKSIQISERNVAESMGQEAETFKRWAKNDFEAAIADVASELRNVTRYNQERAKQAAAREVLTTPEEAAKAYADLKKARWTAEKAKAKNLLTDADRLQVGRLLRGEIELSDLKPQKDNVRGITAVYEASREYEQLAKKINRYKAQQRQKLQEKAAEHLKDPLAWKDKKTGIAYSRETMERNIADIAPDRATADAMIRDYITPVHRAEAKSTRFKTRYRDRVRALNLSQKVQKGNEVSEAYAVQLLGEAEDNIQRIENSRGRMKKRDGETAETWKDIINELKEKNPNLDWTKVENAVAEFRKIYDELFQTANEVRVRNGYEPINYRSGYFPHFQAQGDSFLAGLGRAIGIDTQPQTLPTSINGITGTFRPGITWFKFGQQRKGHQTEYDAVKGFDQYIDGIAPVIYQTDNIQNLRALATEIRRLTADDGIQRQIDAIQADETLTEDEKRAKLEDIYKNGQYSLSNFVNELEEYTNLLANKKSKLDRGMEALIGRRAYTIMKNFESRVGANMVAGNLASAFTNFIPLTQAGAQIDTETILQGMWDTLKAYKNDDGFVDQSTFLTNRRGSDPIVQTLMQKASKVMGTPMEYIDNFTADSIVRARFKQNLKRGMSEALAMEEADDFAAHVMADRSKGAQPTLFASNNPLVKAFTQFQLEVNNQFSEVFKDLPRVYRDKGLAALTAALLKYFFGAYLYNEVYEKIVGRRPALDPIGILNDTVGDLTGYELPNLLTLAGDALKGEEPEFETEQIGFGEAGKNLTQNLLGELPFSSGLTLLGVELDGGRIPVSSAIPDLTALWDAATTEGWSGKKRWDETQQELNKLAYLLPPFGGNQIGKVVKTAKQLGQRGKYTVDAEGNDVMQYPVDNSLDNWVRAAMFGTSSLPESQEFYENGNKALTGEQTAVVRELEQQGIDQETTYNLYQTLRRIGKEKKGAEAGNAKRDAINALDLSDEQKLQVFDAVMLDPESDRYEETLQEYRGMLDAGLSWDEVTQMDNRYAAVKTDDNLDATERARTMERWIDDQDWTADQQTAAKEHIPVGRATQGEDRYDYMKERIEDGVPPETVLVALTEGQQEDYARYIQKANVPAETYLDALAFVSNTKSDKDKKGNTISGSRKKKIVAWINEQKLTRRQKRALFLCFYSENDDTFR